MVIIGIDPGSRVTGYGIIDHVGERLRHVHSGFIRVKGDRLPHKLGDIFEQVSQLIEEYKPEQMGIESVFMNKNADSALKLGQARGAAICAAWQGAVDVHEYAPREVKLALVGTGSADKSQVNHMVCRLLSLQETVQADEADALAIAICHAQQAAVSRKTGLPAEYLARRRRGRR